MRPFSAEHKIMRINLPVTQREFDFPAGVTLMSATDANSHITYANEAFIHVSGFSRDAIIGQAHNVVRHPDMPTEAFADMWETLKSGLSWTALVKNRRCNGDHYWVRANATPVIRNGKTIGYMSVRTKPGRDEVAAAERLYSNFREHKAGRFRFHQGLIVRTGACAWISWLQTMPIRWRIRASSLISMALIITSAWLCGMQSTLLGVFSAAVGGVALLATRWLNVQIHKPLQAVLKQALAVAAGQPSENLHLNRVDEIGMILRAVNQAGLNLCSLGDDVSEQLAGLQQISTDITTSNQHLNTHSTQATFTLQQTAAEMRQMTATVRENADTACQASALAAAASSAASQGHAVVNNVVTTMQDITRASQMISDIINTIEGIAFQTNILALNAAVEAARAGEQGRGFAVVAGEVQALAQRSATAAKEIAEIIHDNVEKTARGGEMVDQAGNAMRHILDQVSRVTELINEISTATQEQAVNIGQVNAAVTQLDEMTRQNGTLVQTSAEAANHLQIRTDRLINAVAAFRSGVSSMPL